MVSIIKPKKLIDYIETDEIFFTIKEKILNKTSSGTFYILEHEPCYTIGKNGGIENLLATTNLPVYQTERGGNITYHGPGQIVVYPIINIKELKIGVKDFIFRLEDVVINTLNHFNIDAVRNSINHGVWVDNSKIASVGVKISKGITQHGIALNINNSLEPFSNINPCGLKNISITSVRDILKNYIDIDEVKKYIEYSIQKKFPECFSE